MVPQILVFHTATDALGVLLVRLRGRPAPAPRGPATGATACCPAVAVAGLGARRRRAADRAPASPPSSSSASTEAADLLVPESGGLLRPLDRHHPVAVGRRRPRPPWPSPSRPLRHGAYARWLGWTSARPRAASRAVPGISPLQYMAGMTGPLWLRRGVAAACSRTAARGLTWRPTDIGAAGVDFEAYVAAAAARPAPRRGPSAVTSTPPRTCSRTRSSGSCRAGQSIRDRGAADAYVRRTIAQPAPHLVPPPVAPRRVRRPRCPTRVVEASVRTTAGLWDLVPAAATAACDRRAALLREPERARRPPQVLGCSTGTVKSNTSRALADPAPARRPTSALAG